MTDFMPKTDFEKQIHMAIVIMMSQVDGYIEPYTALQESRTIYELYHNHADCAVRVIRRLVEQGHLRIALSDKDSAEEG